MRQFLRGFLAEGLTFFGGRPKGGQIDCGFQFAGAWRQEDWLWAESATLVQGSGDCPRGQRRRSSTYLNHPERGRISQRQSVDRHAVAHMHQEGTRLLMDTVAYHDIDFVFFDVYNGASLAKQDMNVPLRLSDCKLCNGSFANVRRARDSRSLAEVNRRDGSTTSWVNPERRGRQILSLPYTRTAQSQVRESYRCQPVARLSC